MKLSADIIAGFVGSILAKRFDGATASPQFHHELWGYACSPHPYVAIAAPRGHAKSTAGTLAYGLAELLFRASRYLLIVSDTESQAEMFVRAMADELQTNEDLVELFGLKKNEKGEVQFLKDSQSDIVVEFADGHTFRVMGKGAEQKLRGLLWNGSRPDLIIVDDLENDELVMNKDRRDKLRRWFNAALRPAMAPKGKLRMWGTVLHMDSLLEGFMPKDNSKFLKVEPLKMYVEWPDKRVRGWLSVKYRAHTDDFKHILWEERFSEEHFRALRADYSEQGIPDVYSQEYLNIPIDESVSYFKRSDLLGDTEEDQAKRLIYYCTVDLAISEESRADYSVFLVAGVDEDKVIHIKNVIRERLDGREIVDYLLSLHDTYDFELIGIEDMMISKAIGPFLREKMVEEDIWPTIVELKHRGKDKIQRARTIQARMRAKRVKFDKKADWYPTLESELLRFPRDKHDDQVDALAYLGLLLDKVVEAPTNEEVEEEEYLDELRQSGYGESGRSAITGY